MIQKCRVDDCEKRLLIERIEKLRAALRMISDDPRARDGVRQIAAIALRN